MSLKSNKYSAMKRRKDSSFELKNRAHSQQQQLTENMLGHWYWKGTTPSKDGGETYKKNWGIYISYY